MAPGARPCGSAGGVAPGGRSVMSWRCGASQVAAVGSLLAAFDEVDGPVEAADAHDLERVGVRVEAAAAFADPDDDGHHPLRAAGRSGFGVDADAVDADLVLRRHAARGDDEQHLAREVD